MNIFSFLTMTKAGREAIAQIDEYRTIMFRNAVHDSHMDEITTMWSLRNESRWI
jgi:hypothetical protein